MTAVRVIVNTAVICFLSSCEDEAGADVNEVYQCVVSELSSPWDLVIEDLTSVEGLPDTLRSWAAARESLPTLREDTWESFAMRNRVRARLTLTNAGERHVTLLSEADRDQIFRDGSPILDNWGRFYAAYPRAGGLISLSAIGLGRDGRQALVYYHVLHDSGIGYSWLVVLADNGARGWRIEGKRAVRIG